VWKENVQTKTGDAILTFFADNYETAETIAEGLNLGFHHVEEQEE